MRVGTDGHPHPREEAALSEQTGQITAATIVEQVVTRHPATVPVFLRWRMHCVGCPIARFETIAEACRVYGRPVDRLLAELHAAASGSNGPR